MGITTTGSTIMPFMPFRMVFKDGHEESVSYVAKY